MIFTVTKTSCRVLLYDIVCMYLKENCLEQLSGQERKTLYNRYNKDYEDAIYQETIIVGRL